MFRPSQGVFKSGGLEDLLFSALREKLQEALYDTAPNTPKGDLMFSRADLRVVFLARASARLILVEAGEVNLDDAVPGMACPTCGAAPCVNPSFCSACRKADRKKRDVVPTKRPTPRPTIEAVMHAVRERGLAALKEPAAAERLERCDAEARTEINKRIEKLGLRP